MTKYPTLEVIWNNNGPHIIFENDTPEQRSAALNKMQFDLENAQYLDKNHKQLLDYVRKVTSWIHGRYI